MSEDNNLFSDSDEFKFKYSLFFKAVLWLGGPAMILLPAYEYYRGTLDYQENEHFYALGVFLLGLVAMHAAWRTLGYIIFTPKGISHVRLGRTTFISYSAIREIRNRPWLMSLKVIGPENVIYIEKQIQDYPLAYEILHDKTKGKLERSQQKRLSMPLIVRTAGKQYRFALSICVVAAAVIGSLLWRNETNLVVFGVASGFLLFGAYLLYELYLIIEIDWRGIVMKGVLSKVVIPRSHIDQLLLERDYNTGDDPTFNIHIDYLEMPVDKAPDEAEIYTKVIPGALIDVPTEPLFDLMTREYGFEEDDGKED
jgi:hypothetical protein